MKNNDIPIRQNELTFLQAYLYELFNSGKTCHNNFEHTDWYLNDKYSGEEMKKIKHYFNNNNITCDCDIIFKLDTRNEFKKLKTFH